MPSQHQLSREQARRLALTAQSLTAERPAGVVETVDALAIVNIDPTAAVALSADHILWSRIGWPYAASDLVRAIEVDRAVFEWAGFYRPMSDLELYLPLMHAWPPYRAHREWLVANERFQNDVLARLRAEGPLRTGQIPDTSQVPWTSSGWTNNRNVSQMLEFLTMRGDVALAGREGKERLWDVAERVYPRGVALIPADDAALARAERRLGYLGIARAKGIKQPAEPIDVGDVGEPATVSGTGGEWRVDPSLLGLLDTFEGRTALLSPFDRLVFDRSRLLELFDFEYILEMYKPAAKRRWGYFALPILHGDRLVGKLDCTADRKAGVLRVAAIHEDTPFTTAMADAVDAEILRLAEWLGMAVA